MSEKIKDMVQQAGTDVSGKWMSTNNAEQFAELIVRECADAYHETRSAETTILQHFRQQLGLNNE
jgi:hypothetical protein